MEYIVMSIFAIVVLFAVVLSVMSIYRMPDNRYEYRTDENGDEIVVDLSNK